jgi:hypothetical protein
VVLTKQIAGIQKRNVLFRPGDRPFSLRIRICLPGPDIVSVGIPVVADSPDSHDNWIAGTPDWSG